MTDSSCPICTDSFNASNRKPISCPIHICQRQACRTCYETFLCGDDVSVPKCLFCNTSFTHSQLQHIGLTKSFLHGKFARHQEDILFAQEQAMLPAAQAAIAHDRLVQNIDAQIKDVSAQIKQLLALRNDLMQTKRRLLDHGGHDHDLQDSTAFVHRCADSLCNGFVSSAWKCATCDKHTCAHCRELKTAHDDPLHLCNPDSVASVALLKADTKPCPNCKVPVHKTDGCDQMFCTLCKRLWSWNTGRFETRGHNPHYLQWMRENHHGGLPREHGDVLCGREIDPHFLSRFHFASIHVIQADPTLRSTLTNIERCIGTITHLRFQDLPRFLIDPIALNFHSRKAFVANTLSLHKFKHAIRRNHTRSLKFNAIHSLLSAILPAATDIAFRILHYLSSNNNSNNNNNNNYHHYHDTLTSFHHELHSLIAYANHELNIIHHDFHSTTLQHLLLLPHAFKLTL